MSLGRYGADNPGERKVSLEITVDKWVSDALGKIRRKKSVSSFVNGVLGLTITHYDPGPSSPFVYDLVKVMEKYKKEAEESGDSGMLAAVNQLHYVLEPYIDLAEAEPAPSGDSGNAPSPQVGRSPREYNWYVVPVLHCGVPMSYMRASAAWKCVACGFLLQDL